MTLKQKSSVFYTDDEMKAMKKKWLEDKARIDADPAFSYYVDRYQEYAKHLANKNLQAMFLRASRLYRMIQEGDPIKLYPGEMERITEVFRRIERDGYYSRSKVEERKVRVHIGKISSRQSRPRNR